MVTSDVVVVNCLDAVPVLFHPDVPVAVILLNSSYVAPGPPIQLNSITAPARLFPSPSYLPKVTEPSAGIVPPVENILPSYT